MDFQLGFYLKFDIEFFVVVYNNFDNFIMNLCIDEIILDDEI